MPFSTRTFLAAWALVFGIAIALASPAAVKAQQLPTPQILVIDVNYVMANSSAMQSIQSQIEDDEGGLEQQMQERERQLREEDEALSRQRSVLSSEAFEERRQQLEQQFADYQREFSQRLEGMDESYAEAVGEVEMQLVRVADELATEHGANIVVPKSTLVLVHEDFDKTEQALQRLNERLPSVSVNR